MSSERELPKGWAMTTLGEVVKFVGGGTPSKAVLGYFEGNIPFMTVKDMKTRFPSDTQDHITEEALFSSTATMVEPDTLIVATRMALGKIVRPTVVVAINQDLKAVYPCEQLDKTYFEYFWHARAAEFERLGTGTTVKGLRLDKLNAFPIPLPPLAEQVRIADKLEATLARVEAARERLERVPALLARLRQSILSAAMSGELTRDWRGGGDAEWEETTLGKVAKVVGGGTPEAGNPDNFQEEGGIPWVTPADLSGYNSMYIARGKRNLSQKGYDGSSAKLMPKGTVLFSSRAPIGYVAIAQNEICTNQGFKSLIPSEKVDSKFLFFHLKSIKDVAEQRATGTTFKELSGKATALLPISLPPLPEQLEIVRRVEAMFAHIEALEAQHRAALQMCEQLTPALLQKAFRGELVPQDPNDEPASVLLERIRAERAATKPKKGASKSKKTKA